jgi:multiple sugar transport system permease protein
VGELAPQQAPVDRSAWVWAAALRASRAAAAAVERSAWQGPDVAEAVTKACTPAIALAALDETLARLEIEGLELTTDDAQLFQLIGPDRIAAALGVEQGNAQCVPSTGGALVRYDFRTQDSPIVLALPFTLPPGIRPQDLHRLTVQLHADGSWHTVTAELELGGRRWRTSGSTPLAQVRESPIAFQPPGFDDTTYRIRTWEPLVDAGPATGSSPVLRLTIHPSSALRVAWERIARNYVRAFLAVPFWTYLANSALLVFLVVTGSMLSSAFVAYAFARLRWPGRSFAFLLLLGSMMLPSQVTMVPSFLVWRELGMYNTLNPLWMGAWLGNAFFIFLMAQQLRSIPKELEEAARIDGLNAVQTWWYVILPQLGPSLAAIAIMSFIGAWNDFMGPLIYLRDQGRFPLSLGLFGMKISGVVGDFGVQLAGGLLMTLPTIIVFFCFQRYFIQGMSASGIKG